MANFVVVFRGGPLSGFTEPTKYQVGPLNIFQLWTFKMVRKLLVPSIKLFSNDRDIYYKHFKCSVVEVLQTVATSGRLKFAIFFLNLTGGLTLTIRTNIFLIKNVFTIRNQFLFIIWYLITQNRRKKYLRFWVILKVFIMFTNVISDSIDCD